MDASPSVAQTEDWRPAGFWIRFAADIADTILIYAPVTLVIGSIASALGVSDAVGASAAQIVSVLAGGVYYTALTARTGQTWGKKIFDLTVVNEDGSPLDAAKSLMRWCSYLLSYLTCCIGFMMAGWNEEKKALHDYVTRTRVVRKGGGSGAPAWKVVAGAAAVGVVLLALIAAAAGLWVSRNKGKLIAMGDEAKSEGAAFAAGKSQEDCLAESLARATGAGVFDEIRHRIFLKSCLDAASPSPGFCEGTPPSSSIMATVAWRIERCERIGRSEDQSCGRLLDAVQEHCVP